jgi:TonB family protein
MKPLGFLVSLLAHLLFLLLIVRIQFPVQKIEVKPQIIQIVPMSPPLPSSRPLYAPVPVYVRPFFLKGGALGKAGGATAGQAARAKTGTRTARVPAVGRVEASGRSLQPKPGISPGQDAQARQKQIEEKRSKFSIDLGGIARKLREKSAAGETDVIVKSSSLDGGEGLSFGDVPPAGEGEGVSPLGDGTSSNALGGNAFFDARGYDITPWAKRMVYRVKKNWISPPASSYGLKGSVGIYLLIERDGAIRDVHIRKTSGIRPFDQAAFNAIELSAPLAPLPDDYPRADLAAYLLFYYN